MCRLLGIAALSLYDYRLMLCRAPRSLAVLSREHRDGWGLALHDGEPGTEWLLRKSTKTAEEDPLFPLLAQREHGRVLIAHVRQKTVGALAPENTHPFQRGRWVFAHNGTLRNVAAVRARTSPERLAELGGDTDSELFFAYLLTRLDEAGVTFERPSAAADRAVRDAVHAAAALDDFGTLDALLSNGESLWAMRFGRPLYLLERRASSARRCVLVASEPLTDEPWSPLEHGTLLRLDPLPEPRAIRLS